jgi:hypothetical protein
MEHHDRQKKFYDDLRTFRNDNQKISDLNREYQEFVRKKADEIKDLVSGHGKDPAAFDGALVLVRDLSYPFDDELVTVILDHHLANSKMGHFCFALRYRSTESWAEKLL